MVHNQIWVDKQEEMATQYYMSPFNDGKKPYKYEDVPFPDLEKVKSIENNDINRQENSSTNRGIETINQNTSKTRKFDKQKAWNEAPEYNLNSIKKQLSGFG